MFWSKYDTEFVGSETTINQNTVDVYTEWPNTKTQFYNRYCREY